MQLSQHDSLLSKLCFSFTCKDYESKLSLQCPQCFCQSERRICVSKGGRLPNPTKGINSSKTKAREAREGTKQRKIVTGSQNEYFFSMVIRLTHWTNEFMERVENVPTEIFIICITRRSLSERVFCISNDGQRLYECSGGR